MVDINPAVIKKTQETLGKFVKRPPLSDKLLKKPPFRFLHDVINVIIKETGFFNGLYTPEELISDNINNKENKILFLQKAIDVVKFTTNTDLKVKPSKIVAGHEPERTNEFLQAIGLALEKKLKTDEAVEWIKNGKPTQPPVAKIKESNKSKSTKVNSTISPTSTKVSGNVNKLKRSSNSLESEEKLIKSTTKATIRKDVSENILKSSHNKSKLPISNKPTNNKSSELIKKSGKETEIREITPKPEHNLQIKQHSVDNENLQPKISNPPLIEQPIEINSNDNVPLSIVSATEEHQLISTPTQQIEQNESIEIQSKTKPLSATIRKIQKSESAELVDVIDQEAEIRRKEKLKSNSESNKNVVNSIDAKDLPITENNPNTETNATNSIDKKPPELIRNKSFVIQKDDKSVNRPRTSLRPPSVRPASARPGAPRRRDRNIEIVLPSDETVQLAGINVKVESFHTNELEDDGENLVIIEDPTTVQDDLNHILKENNSNVKNLSDGQQHQQQGHLVQQILETQKVFSSADDIEQNTQDKKQENDINSTISVGERQSSAKQLDTLKESIQKLTRSINPLGKLMDFFQEDIDSMQMELTQWQNVYTNAVNELKKEKGLTDTVTEPLKYELAQIELTIKEYNEMINISRANILQNNEKIFKLLSDL